MATPPEEFVCPISLGVMANPTMVFHHDNVYWFDKRSLELHAQTPHCDRNPLTNETGFSTCRKICDMDLKNRILESPWADNIEEPREDLENENPETPTDSLFSPFEALVLFSVGSEALRDGVVPVEPSIVQSSSSLYSLLPEPLSRTLESAADALAYYVEEGSANRLQMTSVRRTLFN